MVLLCSCRRRAGWPALACGLSGSIFRRNRHRQLGLGPPHGLRGYRNGIAGLGRLHARFAAYRLWLRMPRIGTRGEETVMLDDPEVRLALSGRSGPLVVEIEYRLPRRTRERFTT